MKMMSMILYSLPVMASVLITPEDALKATFGTDIEVSKKSLLLKASQAKKIEKESKTVLESKLVRLYIAKEKTLKAYGILLNRKVRTKKTAVLYMMTPNARLKAAEIVLFQEPIEYLPTQTWIQQFNDVNDSKSLRIGQDISVITGATMSARTITDGARQAMAIFNEVIKK